MAKPPDDRVMQRIGAALKRGDLDAALGEAVQAVLAHDCPLCGHRSIYKSAYRPEMRCLWPGCDYRQTVADA